MFMCSGVNVRLERTKVMEVSKIDHAGKNKTQPPTKTEQTKQNKRSTSGGLSGFNTADTNDKASDLQAGGRGFEPRSWVHFFS